MHKPSDTDKQQFAKTVAKQIDAKEVTARTVRKARQGSVAAKQRIEEAGIECSIGRSLTMQDYVPPPVASNKRVWRSRQLNVSRYPWINNY